VINDITGSVGTDIDFKRCSREPQAPPEKYRDKLRGCEEWVDGFLFN